jgi:hypothetical protein
MTLTLEITPEIEAQIERAAAITRTDVSSFIMEAATEKAANTYQVQTAARRAAVEAAFGCARGNDSVSGWIVADFNEDKAADIEAENARDLI